ncbi:UxaA family hydrolase [Candidatus Borrarchaeum sp.]|uniref:UxaA family hydrolase n=1 Tax=Candidatus Borrarchaeum sp. TaxID=2846742 RepID=UPI00257BAEBC|nr:UxaA family hydrolase [Candidatus Borrarchaeum sp.]
MSEKRAIVINEKDNVATLISDVKAGDIVIVRMGDSEDKVTVINDIKFGHKFAVKSITEGDEIIKYGEVIGRATAPITIGEHAHIQNIESLRGRGDL